MFATPLLSTDDKLVILPLTYINSTDFFTIYQSSNFTKKESIEVPFPSYILDALTLSSTLDDYLVRDVMNAHDYFGYHNYDKWRRTMTRRWIIEGFNELRHQIVSEWIINHSDIAAIIRANHQHNIFPISYDPIDNDLFWNNINNGVIDLSLIRVNEFITLTHQPREVSMSIDLFIDYIVNHWNSRRLQQSIKNRSCINKSIEAIHFGISLCRYPGRPSLDKTFLGKIDRITTVWRTIGRIIDTDNVNISVLHRWMNYYTYTNFNDESNISIGIAMSGNLRLLNIWFNNMKIWIDNAKDEDHSMIPIRRIIVNIVRYGTDDMVEYIRDHYVTRTLLVISGQIDRTIKANRRRSVRPPVIEILNQGDILSNSDWKNIRRTPLLESVVLQAIQVNNVGSLKTLPLSYINDNRLLIARIKKIINTN